MISRHCNIAVLLIAACMVGAANGNERQVGPWVTPAIPAPRLQRHVFHSQAVHADVSCHMYTPEAYDVDLRRRFPLVIWLHGRGGGQEGMVTRLVTHFDQAIRDGDIPPVIVIIPNGLTESMWCDSKDGRVPMETILVKELLPYVDRTFRTIASRESRMIEGFSMGGYGAARLGLKYPGLFGAASILGAGPMQRELNALVGPPGMARVRQRVLRSVYGGDQSHFKALSPWTLAEEYAETARDELKLRLAVGSRDSMLAANRDFDKHLADLGIPHQTHIVPDVGHHPIALFNALGDVNWDFYREAFQATTTISPKDEPRTYALVIGKARLVDSPRQQRRAADAVNRVAKALRRLGPEIVVDALSEEVMTREQVGKGEARERVTGSVFLVYLTRLAETASPKDTVIIYTHTHGVKKGSRNPESPGGIVLDPPTRRAGHRGLLDWVRQNRQWERTAPGGHSYNFNNQG